MDRKELLADIKQARELGDPDLELSLLEKLDTINKPESNGDPNILLNVLKGAAARGNQAFSAINPFMDKDRIAAEQEWVKQNKGADIGSTLADIAITFPAGGAASIPARALATGAIEGLTNPGDLIERVKNAGYSALGSGIGDKLGDTVGFLAKPFKESTDDTIKALQRKAADLGINLNAAQKTGNKSLQYADSALDSIPASSGMQQEFKDAQRKAWQSALFKQGHESADIASPEVMGAMKDRISSVYNDVAERNSLLVDPMLKADLAGIRSKYSEIIPTNQKGIVKKYLNDFGLPQEGAEISGKTYQSIRSMLDKQAQGFKNSDPATHEALKEIRSSIDAAMERGLSNPTRIGGNADDIGAWKQANKDWMVMKNIESGVDPVTGNISPDKLLSMMKRKDANRVIYGKGDQELTDIAKVGKQFISSKVPDSGTAQRALMTRLLTGGGLGGLAATAMYDPTTALGLGAAGLLGAVALPRGASKMMQNQGGYLTKGILDLSKEAMDGVTRQQVISELLRNAGIQSLNQTNR